MSEFIHWIFGINRWTSQSGPFYIPVWPVMLSYALFGVGILLVDTAVHIKYPLFPLSKRWHKNLAILQSARRYKFLWTATILLLIAFVGLEAIAVSTFFPVSEELLFRGIIVWLSKKQLYLTAFTAGALASLVFGTIHKLDSWFLGKNSSTCSWQKVVNSAFAGLIYAMSCIVTCSLWPAIFAHSGWNLFQTLVYYFWDEKEEFFQIEMARR